MQKFSAASNGLSDGERECKADQKNSSWGSWNLHSCWGTRKERTGEKIQLHYPGIPLDQIPWLHQKWKSSSPRLAQIWNEDVNTHIPEAPPFHKAPGQFMHSDICWKCGFCPAFLLQKPQEKCILHFNCQKHLKANSVTASKITSGFQESRNERVILFF